MKNLHISKLATFLLLCFGMSWGGFALLQAQLSSSPWIQGILAIMFIWGPGIAAILTHTFIWGEPLTTLGYYKKPLSWRDWSRSYLWPVGIVLILLGLIFVFGNIFHIPSAGKVVLPGQSPNVIELNGPFFFSYSSGNNYIFEGLLSSNGFFLVPLVNPNEPFANSNAFNFFLFLLVSWALGAFLFSFVLRGEELGFRGFLVNELKSKGFLGSNLIIGTIWGLYTSGPTLLFNNTNLSISAVLFTIGYCISLSFPLAYLRLKSDTIRSTSVFRGLLTMFTVLLFFLTWDTDIAIWGPTGLLGMGIFLLITFLIIRKDPEFIKAYEPEE